jgi:pseudouridine kinase
MVASPQEPPSAGDSAPGPAAAGGRARVACVGGATLDRKYRAVDRLVPGTSNPAEGRTGFGGVARNVAENLVRLGVATALVTAVGEDEAGASILRHLQALGVDCGGVLRAAGRRTAEYVAVLEPQGELARGLADLEVLSLLTPEVLGRAWPLLTGASWVLADCNLPAATLAHLVARPSRAGFRLAVDGVSTPKVVRLPDDLSGVDCLFLNLDEARALAAAPSADAEGATRLLLRRGAGAIVLTRGGEGALLATAQGLAAIPAAPAAVVDVTGAGDALVAGTLALLAAGADLPRALDGGVAAAALATETDLSVHPDLSMSLLAGRLARSRQSAGAPA